MIATARKPETLDDLAAAHPGRAVPVALDVTDPAQIKAVVAEAVLWYGRIDVLVNNAGRGHVGAVEETTDAELRVPHGPALLRARRAHPGGAAAHARPESGAIVQFSSMGGRMSFPGVGAYSATKFALEGLSEALAAEVRAARDRRARGRTGRVPDRLRRRRPVGLGADRRVRGDRGARSGTAFPDSNGKQPGDPAKAAAAILEALAAEQVPLRLALGNDAADAIGAELKSQTEELAAWEHVSRGTDFDA